MDFLVKEFSLTAIVNAIRKQSGSLEPLCFPDEFIKAVENAEGKVTDGEGFDK